MTILKNDIVLAPFIGENLSFSVGLNPLGIRTASEQLFTTLLPGMNVVTLRIRYYSFYCWLLKCFYDTRDIANLADLRRHIRISELLMALIHAKSGDGLGIPGITYAQSMINENKEEYNLVDGAMPNGKATGGYWKGSLGAMGTYYIASLAEMGLVAPLTDNMHLYNITKKTDANYITGEHLADAFEKSVGKESSLLFLKCLSEGIVNNNELDILVKTFKAKSMNIGDETNLLIAMLLQHDNPAAETKTYMRRNTIQLLLNYFITNEVDYLSELKFARYVYNEFKRGNTKSVSAIGWYAYYLNDSRQYESLIIFSELLKRLNNSNMPGGWELIENITSDLADEVCIDFAIESETLEEVIDNWDMYKRPLNIMSEAFYVILDDYVQNKSYDDYKSELRLFFHGIHNDAMDSFDTIKSYYNYKFHDYIQKFLTDNIIYTHYCEAMRKFSQNGVATQKLTIENGYVKGLECYEATHSSPRINTLFNFVSDLGLIANYKLTKKGEELLNQLNND